MITQRRSAQSLVEYVVLLALIAIIVVTVTAGIGRQTRGRIALPNDALAESRIASETGGKIKPADAEVTSGELTEGDRLPEE